jgi:AcrR family transcriptional regulator
MADGNNSRHATEQRLIEAVGTLIAREGFSALGVNAIAREAGVSKVLIYRYFDGMPGLLRVFSGSDSFWPSVDEVLGTAGSEHDLRAEPPERLWSQGLVRYGRALRARHVAREVLAWEQVEKNELTETLRVRREAWFDELLAELPNGAGQADPEVVAGVLFLATAIHYLVARSRLHGDFNGLRIETEDDWATIEQLVESMCRRTLNAQRGATRGATK